MIKHIHFLSSNAEIGFFAYYFQALDCLHRFASPETPVFINFENSLSYYDPSVRETSNLWEYTFEQPMLDQVRLLELLNGGVDFTTREFQGDHLYGIDSINHCYKKSDALIQLTRDLVKKYIKIKVPIREKIEKFYQQKMREKKILGVNKRGTEHYISGHGRGQGHLLTYDYYFSKIDPLLESERFTHLYLTTDEEKSVEVFEKKYGNRLIYRAESFRSVSGKDITHCFEGGRYKIAEDALIDAYLLSYADHAVLTSSNLVIAAITFNDRITYEFIDSHLKYD